MGGVGVKGWGDWADPLGPPRDSPRFTHNSHPKAPGVTRARPVAPLLPKRDPQVDPQTTPNKKNMQGFRKCLIFLD